MPDTPAPRTKPTMAQIALRASTSVPTVSKVLNGGTDVSEETRVRVMRAAHDLGYTKSSKLRTISDSPRASRVVDVVVGHIDGTWISRVLAGIEAAAADADFDLVLTVARPDGNWITRLLRRPSLGAIVLLVDATTSELHLLTTADIPVVVIDPMSRPPSDVASVGSANWSGGRMAAEHLIEHGHSRFGVIGGTRSHPYSSARIDGFVSVLRDVGLTLPRRLIAFCDWDRLAARNAASAMLRSDSPTAIFACSDIMALGVFDAAGELGLTVPGDVSVIGFDDIRESTWSTPPLTTVQQPLADMGAAAVEMLLRTQRQSPHFPGPRSSRIELETRLIERSSTARLGLGDAASSTVRTDA